MTPEAHVIGPLLVDLLGHGFEDEFSTFVADGMAVLASYDHLEDLVL